LCSRFAIPAPQIVDVDILVVTKVSTSNPLKYKMFTFCYSVSTNAWQKPVQSV